MKKTLLWALLWLTRPAAKLQGFAMRQLRRLELKSEIAAGKAAVGIPNQGGVRTRCTAELADDCWTGERPGDIGVLLNDWWVCQPCARLLAPELAAKVDAIEADIEMYEPKWDDLDTFYGWLGARLETT